MAGDPKQLDYAPPDEPSRQSFAYAMTIAGRIIIAGFVAFIVALVVYAWRIYSS